MFIFLEILLSSIYGLVFFPRFAKVWAKLSFLLLLMFVYLKWLILIAARGA